MSCKSTDSPESVSLPGEETPTNPNTATSPASTTTGTSTVQNTTCRNVPDDSGTGVVSQCSFCPNCIMEEEVMIAAGRSNDNCRELIKEVNIRLAGFGGSVPTDQFTEQTTKVIKQFQRDYMRLPLSGQTGYLCKPVLEAIDHFSTQYPVTDAILNQPRVGTNPGARCDCISRTSGNRCQGFGTEANGERPGFHRSLCWSLKAAMFYMVKESRYGYSLLYIACGYRCGYNNTRNSRTTTNHMGNAFDLHFNINGQRERNAQNVRNRIFIPYMATESRTRIPSRGQAADYGLATHTPFYLEPNAYSSGASGATTWVHIDCHSFSADHKAAEFYVQTQVGAEGSTLIQTATNLALGIINCTKTFDPSTIVDAT